MPALLHSEGNDFSLLKRNSHAIVQQSIADYQGSAVHSCIMAKQLKEFYARKRLRHFNCYLYPLPV
jgi:hypothetical protein